MNISPESLQAFAQAAHSGSLSAAARRLGKSQSTISEAVARLEIDLGVTLFERGPRRLQLTEAGASLLAHADEVLAAADRLARHAAGLASGVLWITWSSVRRSIRAGISGRSRRGRR